MGETPVFSVVVQFLRWSLTLPVNISWNSCLDITHPLIHSPVCRNVSTLPGPSSRSFVGSAERSLSRRPTCVGPIVSNAVGLCFQVVLQCRLRTYLGRGLDARLICGRDLGTLTTTVDVSWIPTRTSTKRVVDTEETHPPAKRWEQRLRRRLGLSMSGHCIAHFVRHLSENSIYDENG